MATVVLDEQVEIPFVDSLSEFRQWALSSKFPRHGRIDYIGGRIEVDMSPEDFFTHGTLKTVVASAIAERVRELDLGHTCISDTRLSCPTADLSAEPDVIVITYQALDDGRVRLTPKTSGEADRYVEVEGAADLVVEIVSDSSSTKDNVRLPKAYFQAGIREFWLIDARGPELTFQIYHRAARGFSTVQADDQDRQRSEVLESAYRLHRLRHKRGHFVYELRAFLEQVAQTHSQRPAVNQR